MNDALKNNKAFSNEVKAYIQARYPIICLESFEEARVIKKLNEISEEIHLPIYTWSRTKGITLGDQEISNATDPISALNWFDELKKDSLLLLLDYHPYLKDSLVIRKLRDLGKNLKLKRQNLLLLSPQMNLPEELTKEVTLIKVPLPGPDEIETLVEQAYEYSNSNKEIDQNFKTLLQDAAAGLTHDEIENALARSLVSTGSLNPKLIQEEKKQIIRKNGLLEFVDSGDQSLPDVGGLENLKSWITQRQKAFSKEAEVLRLPKPKGVLLVGIPGCGKSLTAMTISKIWNKPLLRLDLGKVYSGLVGSSENNIRQAIQVAETVAPCILWVDEIEKGLSGSSGGSDGGTSSRVFGTLLTWMQEKKSPVFVVATANDISKIPPEFLRKGRFDEIFFIDLPTVQERKDILRNLFKKFDWNTDQINCDKIAMKSEGYSGAELEQVIINARFEAFHLNQNLTEKMIEDSLKSIIPLSQMMKEQVDSSRKWALGRARMASVGTKVHSINKTNPFKTRTQSVMENEL